MKKISIVCFCIIVLSLFMFKTLTTKNDEYQLDRVQNALKEAILTCYSIEGSYPSSIEYLKENYGLQINLEEYVIHYDLFSSNMMPEWEIFKKGNNHE